MPCTASAHPVTAARGWVEKEEFQPRLDLCWIKAAPEPGAEILQLCSVGTKQELPGGVWGKLWCPGEPGCSQTLPAWAGEILV